MFGAFFISLRALAHGQISVFPSCLVLVSLNNCSTISIENPVIESLFLKLNGGFSLTIILMPFHSASVHEGVANINKIIKIKNLTIYPENSCKDQLQRSSFRPFFMKARNPLATPKIVPTPMDQKPLGGRNYFCSAALPDDRTGAFKKQPCRQYMQRPVKKRYWSISAVYMSGCISCPSLHASIAVQAGQQVNPQIGEQYGSKSDNREDRGLSPLPSAH